VSPDDFTRALQAELARRGWHFDAADVRAFVAREWPRIEPDPDPVCWAQEFIHRGHVPSGV
jgi:hypothetical protein